VAWGALGALGYPVIAFATGVWIGDVGPMIADNELSMNNNNANTIFRM
jgi:hypothetical protein